MFSPDWWRKHGPHAFLFGEENLGFNFSPAATYAALFLNCLFSRFFQSITPMVGHEDEVPVLNCRVHWSNAAIVIDTNHVEVDAVFQVVWNPNLNLNLAIRLNYGITLKH